MTGKFQNIEDLHSKNLEEKPIIPNQTASFPVINVTKNKEIEILAGSRAGRLESSVNIFN